MPSVTLPNGTVLVGPKAAEYIKAQAKAQKEAKVATKKKLVEAKKAGDEDAAWAAKADLSSSNAAARMSGADAAQAEVLNEIRSDPSGYTFYRVMPTDWKADAEAVSSYMLCNLRFGDIVSGVSKEAPGSKDISLFTGVRSLKDETIKVMHESDRGRRESLEWYTAVLRKSTILEAHPSLLKKNGKLAIDIPEGAMVAVKDETNSAERLCYGGIGGGGSILMRKTVHIHHKYICAVIPPEMEASCTA
jgi:hypothetical protein